MFSWIIIYERGQNTDNTTSTRCWRHINYEYGLYACCTVPTRPWGAVRSTPKCTEDTHTRALKKRKKRKNKSMRPTQPPTRPLSPTLLRGPCSSTCFGAPSPHSTFYRAWFMPLYLRANRPKLTALQKARRCTGKVHRRVTHIAQPLIAERVAGPSPPNLRASPPSVPPAHGRQVLIWKCYENKT